MAASNPSQAIRSTGNAPVTKVGHTTNGQHGSGVNTQPKGRQSARDLNVK